MKKSIIFTSFVFILSGIFVVNTHAQSYKFNSDLGLGSTGQDVVNLQTWLISSGYSIPSINSGSANKGYFGSETKSAVQSYQRSIGLPAYGFFGPLTRSYWSNHLSNGGNSGGNQGNSLRVISPNGGENWAMGTTQNITWTTSQNFINQTGDIKLEYAVPACAEPTASPRCMIAVRAPLTIASGINLYSGSYAWHVGNSAMACIPENMSGCAIPAGQYKIQICPTSVNSSSQCDDSDNYFNITSGSVSNGQTPIINSIDAPTSLTVNQTGTWTVRATDPLNGTLSYSVDWGDSVYPTAGYSMNAVLPQFTQTTTFTHSYSTTGTYTIAFTVRNNSGLQVQTTTTVVVGVSNTAGPLKIIKPNGGEIWSRGTNQNITWSSPYYYNYTTADLKLLPYQTPCTTQMCPMYALAPYTIATNISINQNSYNWYVGAVTNYSSISQTVPDGQYTVQICQSGTSNCDSSDSTFTITSGQTSNLPDINIISPNGGEIWQVGTNQTVTVNITGDPTKIGNNVSLFLENSSSNGNLSNGYSLGNYSINNTLGIKSFQVNVPTNYIGQNKIYATLNYISSTGYCASSYTGCATAPQMQAYDYSDNYFTITNTSYYPYNNYNTVQCPVGYACTPTVQ